MTIANSCKYRQLFFLYLFLLRVIKESAPLSESNPNYQPPSIESRLDKRTRGMAAATYKGERKRTKEMTLPTWWAVLTNYFSINQIQQNSHKNHYLKEKMNSSPTIVCINTILLSSSLCVLWQLLAGGIALLIYYWFINYYCARLCINYFNYILLAPF
jgi:hypothetical protein